MASTLLAFAAFAAAGGVDRQQSQSNASGARALPPTARFTHLTVQQGLADQIAAEITQDADGFMWFGTFSGLDRYDGYTFVHYRHEDADEHSLSGNVISALYATREGTLWVGSRGSGVNRFNARQQQFDRFQNDPADPHSLPNDSPRMFFEDSRGVLWIATEGGLSRFEPRSGTFVNYRHDDGDPNSLASNAVRSIAEDASGALWLGTANGLSRLDPLTGAFRTYRHDPGDDQSLGANSMWKVVVDHVGLIWMATENGLDSLDPQTGRFSHYRHDASNPKSLSGNPLDALMEDDAGRLWVGTFGAGLSILDVERRAFTVYRHDPSDPASLTYDQVDKIFQDRSGLIWLGTGGGGVDLYNPQQQAMTVYAARTSNPNSLASPFVYSTLEDRDGTIWVGTRNAGLDHLDPATGQITHFPAEPGVPGRLGWPAIQDIKQDNTGALWLAAFGGGVYRRDPATGVFTAYRHDAANPSSLSNDNVRSLSFDENGMLWIATGGGLNRLDPSSGTFTTYRAQPGDPNALPSDLLVGLEADRHGAVWVGSAGEGLQRLDVATGKFTRYSHDPRNPNSLSDDNVFAVHVDRAGAVWVGTQGGGLDRLNPVTGVFVHYRQQDGLPSDRIQSILEDGDPNSAQPGNLWIVTDRGVARLDPSRTMPQSYGAANGLPSSQFTTGSSVDAAGRLLLANLGGLVVFDTVSMRADVIPPPVVLTDLLVDNKPADQSVVAESVEFADRAQVSYAQRVISIEFAALSYRAPALNQYRYKLEGFDPDWITADATRRVATYTNLDPGSYVFRVMAANPEGVWNPVARSLDLTVEPPWWATPAVRALLVILMIGAIAAIYVSRERVLRGQRHRLEVLVGERTEALEAALAAHEAALSARDVFLRSVVHDLKGPMSSLSWQAQILSGRMRQVQSDPSMVEAADAIATGAADAADSIDELRDLTQLAAGEELPLRREEVDLVVLCRNRINARREAQAGRFQFTTREQSLLLTVDRARLGRVLDNLLENAAKYSAPEQRIEIELSRANVEDGAWAILEVHDHGIGIPAAEVSHVFDQYFRASNVGSVAGEGLGLASARQLVRLHGGSLELESREGVGSTFIVRLPIPRE